MKFNHSSFTSPQGRSAGPITKTGAFPFRAASDTHPGYDPDGFCVPLTSTLGFRMPEFWVGLLRGPGYAGAGRVASTSWVLTLCGENRDSSAERTRRRRRNHSDVPWNLSGIDVVPFPKRWFEPISKDLAVPNDPQTIRQSLPQPKRCL